MATNPATVWMTINSYCILSTAAQMSTIVTWVMNAVRESINTRAKIGTKANGST